MLAKNLSMRKVLRSCPTRFQIGSGGFTATPPSGTMELMQIINELEALTCIEHKAMASSIPVYEIVQPSQPERCTTMMRLKSAFMTCTPLQVKHVELKISCMGYSSFRLLQFLRSVQGLTRWLAWRAGPRCCDLWILANGRSRGSSSLSCSPVRCVMSTLQT